MRTKILPLLVALSCCFTVIVICLLCRPQYVVPSTNSGLASPAVKRAMQKMGPLKTYRLHPPSGEEEGGRLEVLVERKWLHLRY